MSFYDIGCSSKTIYYRLRIVAEEYHASIFRKKFSEALTEPEKVMPVEALGLVMISHGEEFGEDSAFG